MKWLITGAGGQLGTTLTTHLEAESIPVVKLTKDELDITNEHQVNQVLSKIKPKIIVNCAAWTDVDGAESNSDIVTKTNSNGPAFLAKSAKILSSRLIHISTDFVFGGEDKKCYSEDDLVCPINLYGVSKANGERFISQINPDSIIIRTAWLYSPYGRNFVKSIMRKLIDNDAQIDVVDDQIGQPTSCDSMINTIRMISDEEHLVGIFHGSSAGSVSRYHFARQIASKIGYNPDRLNPVKSNSVYTPARRPFSSVLCHNRNKLMNLSTPLSWELDFEANVDEIYKQVRLERK